TGLRKLWTVVSTGRRKRVERVDKNVGIRGDRYWANAGIIERHEHILRRFLVGTEARINDLYGLLPDRINDGTPAFFFVDLIAEGRAGAISCRVDNKGEGPRAGAKQIFELMGRNCGSDIADELFRCIFSKTDCRLVPLVVRRYT